MAITPISYEFDGSATQIDCGSDASLDDLHGAAITVEGWIRHSDSSSWTLAAKGAWVTRGWSFGGFGNRVDYQIHTDGTTINGNTTVAGLSDKAWHHVAYVYDNGGDRRLRVYVDGTLVVTTAAATGTIDSDASDNLLIGSAPGSSSFMGGAIGWVRISNSTRYSSTFTPPSRTSPPATDANTVEQWNLDEGTGTTAAAQVSTPTNDGTITAGSGGWNILSDMSTDAPGARIFLGGYVTGAEFDGDGFQQSFSSLTAGQSYVARALVNDEYSGVDFRLHIYDDTNGDSILRYEFGADSTPSAPGLALVTFELPTTARNGVSSDCTAITASLEGTQAGQTIYLHQFEMLPNLIDNPSMETGAGDPWVPSGWTNGSYSTGELVQDTTTYHSGASALNFLNPAGTRTMDLGGFVNYNYDYYCRGMWAYETSRASGAGAFDMTDKMSLQRTNNGATDDLAYNGNGAAWKHKPSVYRGVNVATKIRFYSTSGTHDITVDDLYMFKLTDVSLTVTPASEANSTETSGLRVDGLDTAPATITDWTATEGHARWDWTPRHDAADLAKFGTTDLYIAHFYGNASNAIQVKITAANTIRLYVFNSGGTNAGANWDCTGAIVAGTTYTFELDYSATEATLKVDGVTKITVTTPISFGTVPTTAHWGSANTGTAQADATFAAPTP